MIGKKNTLLLLLVLMTSFTKMIAMHEVTPQQKLYDEWSVAHKEAQSQWVKAIQTPEMENYGRLNEQYCTTKKPSDQALKNSYLQSRSTGAYQEFLRLYEKESSLRNQLADEHQMYLHVCYSGS